VDAGNVLTYTWPNLTPETTYQVAVRAYDAAGNRSTPADASRTTPEKPWDPADLPNEKLGWYSGATLTPGAPITVWHDLFDVAGDAVPGNSLEEPAATTVGGGTVARFDGV